MKSPQRIKGVTGAVLAGGLSSRMGRDKALIRWQGRPLISYPLSLLSGLFDEVVIISRDREAYACFGYPIRGDLFEARGALVGIHSALAAADTPAVFVAACDMPFITEGVVRLIVSALAPGTRAVVPQGPAGLEPLLAVYTRRCLPDIEALIGAGRFRIASLFEAGEVTVIPADRIREVDPGFRSFVNLNTPGELDSLGSTPEAI